VSTLNLINLPYRNCVASTETTVLLQEWAIIVIVALGLIILVVIAVLIAAIACTCLRRANVGQLDIADRQAQHKSEEAIPNFEENENIQSKDDEETDTAVQEYFEPETDTYDGDNTNGLFVLFI
jgi:flagellar biosynthesis/type III secretory pathway M-ring protein FliF/YscJ